MSSYATHSFDTKPRPRIRKPTREQLLKSLEIIGSIPAPLPPELPPSPPASRSVSPAPVPSASSSKRRLDSYGDADGTKRPRTGKHLAAMSGAPIPSSSSDSSLPGPSSSHQHAGAAHDAGTVSTASKPGADSGRDAGESHGSSPLPTPFEPVRRPRRGKGTIQDFDRIHDDYYAFGRAFKYSGDARFWSTYPPSHKHFKALLNPPPQGSPYHTYGGLMSRLESVDALICFVYSLWCQDYSRGRCATLTWGSIGHFLTWCKGKWDISVGVREKAFVGLIHMIEAFIHQRKVQYAVGQSLEHEIIELAKTLPNPNELAKQAAKGARSGPGAQRTPPGMLPSPATLSANSTPTNPGNNTPTNPNNGSGNDSGSGSNRYLDPGPSSHLPAPDLPPPCPIKLDVSVPQTLIWSIKDVVDAQAMASKSMNISQQYLSLPIMREHFPCTFGRMVYSTLSSHEEHEPDIEDDEGELFWPGQCVTGEGLGWVCLMGRAMVREFGKEIGYKGFEAIIPKPDDTERRGGAARV